MLTFKQYIARYPAGHKPKQRNKKALSVEAQIRKNLREAEKESIYTISKWDLMKWIAEEEGDTVEIGFKKDGTVTFQFVDVDIRVETE